MFVYIEVSFLPTTTAPPPTTTQPPTTTDDQLATTQTPLITVAPPTTALSHTEVYVPMTTKEIKQITVTDALRSNTQGVYTSVPVLTILCFNSIMISLFI